MRGDDQLWKVKISSKYSIFSTQYRPNNFYFTIKSDLDLFACRTDNWLLNHCLFPVYSISLFFGICINLSEEIKKLFEFLLNNNLLC